MLQDVTAGKWVEKCFLALIQRYFRLGKNGVVKSITCSSKSSKMYCFNKRKVYIVEMFDIAGQIAETDQTFFDAF